MSKRKNQKKENDKVITNDLDSTQDLDVSFTEKKKTKKKKDEKKTSDKIEDNNIVTSDLDSTQDLDVSFTEKKKTTKKKNEKKTSDKIEDNNIVTNDLDSTQNLDVSFIETKNNTKKKKMVRDTLEKGRREIALQENNEKKGDNSSILLIGTLVVCFVGLMIFIWYHFLTFDHTHTKEIVKEKETVVEKIVDENILFLGDSITYYYDLDKYFDKYRVVNSSVLGVRTGGILEDMKKRVYDYNPSKVFILIGINDLIADKKDDVVPNITSMINLIKENRPYAKIYLESIYPINKTDNGKLSGALKDKAVTNGDIKSVNSELVKISEELNVTYVDVFSKLVLEDGNLDLKYTDDGLHLNSVGYDAVTDVLSKYLDD